MDFVRARLARKDRPPASCASRFFRVQTFLVFAQVFCTSANLGCLSKLAAPGVDPVLKFEVCFQLRAPYAGASDSVFKIRFPDAGCGEVAEVYSSKSSKSSGPRFGFSFFFLGISVTKQEVVSKREAALVAFSRATRTTLAGSMIPASNMSQ